MAKLTLTDLASLTNEQAAIAAINANNAATEAAFELTLTRSGTSPNVMTSNLDMNNFRILNIPAPTDDNDLVRLVDVAEGIRGEAGPQGDPGGPLADGDYGDIVVSSSGTAWGIDTSVMTATARTFNAQSTQATMRSTGLGLGGAAILNVGTSASTVAAGDDSRLYKYVINTKDTDYTFTVADTAIPTIVKHTSGSAHAYTIDPITTTAYEVGTQVQVFNVAGAGVVTLTRGLGVGLYKNGSTTSANVAIAAGGFCSLIQVGSNDWVVTGSNLT